MVIEDAAARGARTATDLGDPQFVPKHESCKVHRSRIDPPGACVFEGGAMTVRPALTRVHSTRRAPRGPDRSPVTHRPLDGGVPFMS